jgi:D-alanyl-D-alanine dipeptidase
VRDGLRSARRRLICSRYGQIVLTYRDADALINDPRVLALGILNYDEPFVDVGNVATLAIDQSRMDVQQLSDDSFHVRSGVADRLARAQASLPDEYQLQLKEGWRPIWVQERLWQGNLDQLRADRPDLTEEALRDENARLVAPPGFAPPHSTGGAVDVALLYRGQYADMGWGFNQRGEGAPTAHRVAEPARQHRNVLSRAMEAAGFVNYPPEWWHWSYGDRYWAFQTSRPAGLYGPR